MKQTKKNQRLIFYYIQYLDKVDFVCCRVSIQSPGFVFKNVKFLQTPCILFFSCNIDMTLVCLSNAKLPVLDVIVSVDKHVWL